MRLAGAFDRYLQFVYILPPNFQIQFRMLC